MKKVQAKNCGCVKHIPQILNKSNEDQMKNWILKKTSFLNILYENYVVTLIRICLIKHQHCYKYVYF